MAASADVHQLIRNGCTRFTKPCSESSHAKLLDASGVTETAAFRPAGSLLVNIIQYIQNVCDLVLDTSGCESNSPNHREQ